jgi:glycine/serine hydroxymethyltransferase
MGCEEMDRICELIDGVLQEVTIVSESEYRMKESFKAAKRAEVKDLCRRFPMR